MACTYALPGTEDFISQNEFKAYLANGGLEKLYPDVKFDYKSLTGVSEVKAESPKTEYEQKQSDMGTVIAYVFNNIPNGKHAIKGVLDEKTKFITEDEFEKLVSKGNKKLGLSVAYQDILTDAIVNNAYTGGVGSIARMSSSKDYPERLKSNEKLRNIRVRVAKLPSDSESQINLEADAKNPILVKDNVRGAFNKGLDAGAESFAFSSNKSPEELAYKSGIRKEKEVKAFKTAFEIANNSEYQKLWQDGVNLYQAALDKGVITENEVKGGLSSKEIEDRKAKEKLGFGKLSSELEDDTESQSQQSEEKIINDVSDSDSIASDLLTSDKLKNIVNDLVTDFYTYAAYSDDKKLEQDWVEKFVSTFTELDGNQEYKDKYKDFAKLAVNTKVNVGDYRYINDASILGNPHIAHLVSIAEKNDKELKDKPTEAKGIAQPVKDSSDFLGDDITYSLRLFDEGDYEKRVSSDKAYADAARLFLNRLLPKVAPKISKQGYIQNGFETQLLSDIVPFIKKANVSKINKTFKDISKALLPIMAKDDVRYYLNGLLISDGKLTSTNGHMIASVKYSGDDVPVLSHNFSDAIYSRASVEGKSQSEAETWIDGRYPKYTKIENLVTEAKNNGEGFVVSTVNLSAYADGIVKTSKFLNGSINQYVPITLKSVKFKDNTFVLSAKYIKEAANLIQKLGYDKAVIYQFVNGISIESQDGNAQVIVMALNDAYGAELFKPFDLNQSDYSDGKYIPEPDFDYHTSEIAKEHYASKDTDIKFSVSNPKLSPFYDTDNLDYVENAISDKQWFDDARFNTNTGKFENKAGKEITESEYAKHSQQARKAGFSIGEATIKRAILTKELISKQGDRSGFSELLDSFLSGDLPESLNGIAYSTSQSQVENPHTEASLLQSMRKVFNAKFGSNWVDRLLATGKFKIISSDEAYDIGGYKASIAQGFYDDTNGKDTTYLVYNNIDKDNDLFGLLNHEIAVHALQLGKNDKEFKAILTQLEQMRDFGNKKVVDAFGRVPKDTKAEHITEEALAYLVQYHPQLGIVKRLLAWFRQAIRNIGKALPAAQKLAIYNYASRMTTDDIAYMAENALRTAPDSLLFDNIGNTDDSVRTSFAGQNAQTADKYQLSTAQERLTKGDDAEQVRKDTGWFKGVDGKWRFEIDDSDARLQPSQMDSDSWIEKATNRENGEPLVNVLVHPALFAAYPQLNLVRVKIDDNIKSSAGFSPESNTITIKDPYSFKGANDEFLNILLHEVQHAIQENEGFASGGSVDSSQQNVLADKYRINELEDKIRVRENQVSEEADYAKQDLIDKANAWAKDYGKGVADWSQKEKLEFYIFEHDSLYNSWTNEIAVLKYGKGKLTSSERYKRLAGEVESRNVQARQYLTAEQRKNTPIESTQDTPNSDVIVMYNGKEMHSAPANAGDNNEIRFSIASNIADRAKRTVLGDNTETPRSLDEFNQILQSGRMPERRDTWNDTADKLVELFADATRPFDVWTRKLPDAIKAAQLVMAKDRAVERKKAFEKEIMLKFGDDIGKSIRAVMNKAGWKDYRATKEMTGQWMTARYAQIANQNLLKGYKEKEQEAFQELDAFNNNPDPMMTSSEIAGERERLANALDRATKKVNQFEAAMNSPDIIDPTVQKHEIGLAGGYNNATAQKHMANIERVLDKGLIEKVANHVYAMNAYKLQQDIKNGKITQEAADKFDKSGFYVPLTGDPRNDDSSDDFFTTGNLNQQNDKRLQGRQTSLAQNGIDASFEQAEKSARYHGWLDFKDKLTEVYDDLVKGFVDTGSTEQEAVREVAEKYGINRHAERQGQRTSDDGIIVRKGDSVWVYDLNNKAAIDALRSINHEETPTLLKPVAFLNAWNSRFITQFMPFFAIKNALMDTFERSENIRARTIPGYDNVDMNLAGKRTLAIASTQTMKLLKKIMSISALGTPLEGGVNFLGMKMDLTVDYSDPETLSILEFLNEGGASTWGDYLNTDSKGLSEKLEKIGTWTKGSMDVVHTWNQSFDLISGYAVYKALREQNVDVKTAATTSLNLFNFSKRGRIMSPIRALWMFAQPAATSAHQLAQSLQTKRGQYRLYSYIIAGYMLYSLLRSGDDDDELGVNNMDELGNFNLYRNIPIPVGNGVYAKIPVGFGLPQLAWSTAVNLAKFTQGNQSAGETLTEMVYGAIKIASPVAPSDTAISDHPAIWFMQSITPQPFKGIANVGMDVNAFGNSLTNAKFAKDNKAKALQGRKTTPEEYKMFAQEMAKLGFDVYPEEVREIARTYMPFPVVFNTLIKQFIENPSREARGKQTVSPFVDRWVLAQDDDALKEKLFYRYIARVNDLSAEASVGSKLTPEEAQLAELGDEINHRINQANGKMAAATKAEKDGKSGKAKLLKLEADRLRDKSMEYLIRQYTKIAA
jgi:hypothetical protein